MMNQPKAEVDFTKNCPYCGGHDIEHVGTRHNLCRTALLEIWGCYDCSQFYILDRETKELQKKLFSDRPNYTDLSKILAHIRLDSLRFLPGGHLAYLLIHSATVGENTAIANLDLGDIAVGKPVYDFSDSDGWKRLVDKVAKLLGDVDWLELISPDSPHGTKLYQAIDSFLRFAGSAESEEKKNMALEEIQILQEELEPDCRKLLATLLDTHRLYFSTEPNQAESFSTTLHKKENVH